MSTLSQERELHFPSPTMDQTNPCLIQRQLGSKDNANESMANLNLMCSEENSIYQANCQTMSENSNQAFRVKKWNNIYEPCHATSLIDVLAELGEIDEEIDEENFPEIDSNVKDEAERIVKSLSTQFFASVAPAVYPTQDGEIAIHFKSPVRQSSVLILLNNGGQAECYAYIGGRNRRAHYAVSEDIPDGFVMEQLGKLRSDVSGAIATKSDFFETNSLQIFHSLCDTGNPSSCENS